MHPLISTQAAEELTEAVSSSTAVSRPELEEAIAAPRKDRALR